MDRDLRRWLRILDALSANSVVLPCSTSRLIPEPFLKGLQEANIQPIVHLSAEIGSISNSELATVFETYRRWGLKEIVLYDQPNLKSKWRSADWSRSGLVERFVDVMLPVLMMQRSAGLIPTLPPLEPGGDYWDLAFLKGTLRSIQRRGHSDLLEDCHIALRIWTHGQSLDWGLGGADRWPEAKPYATPEGCQDHLGFRLYEWYQAIVRDVLAIDLPMRVLNGGYSQKETSSETYWRGQAAESNGSILRFLLGDELPPYVLSFAFPLVTDDQEPNSSASAWFTELGEPNAVVPLAQSILGGGKNWKGNDRKKAYRVYILLSEDPLGIPEEIRIQVLQMARDKQAVIGFSLEDAKRAEKVILPKGATTNHTEFEVELRAHGCSVRTLSADEGQDNSIGQILAGRFKGIMNSTSGVSNG
jgi:hypothetical protein